ncbi:hypothetical protein LTR56_026526 [Elasticomyces elasticus]|nr:hypothetical protein LTR56_026526 [Elasticomyces elasticus]KAK4901472.1 hypothetical protein LTR49_027230 [Elasticomyces elasticus]KAK5736376.1 hypothetical protein LTS12_026207 [Elasticomyces elasticus]
MTTQSADIGALLTENDLEDHHLAVQFFAVGAFFEIRLRLAIGRLHEAREDGWVGRLGVRTWRVVQSEEQAARYGLAVDASKPSPKKRGRKAKATVAVGILAGKAVEPDSSVVESRDAMILSPKKRGHPAKAEATTGETVKEGEKTDKARVAFIDAGAEIVPAKKRGRLAEATSKDGKKVGVEVKSCADTKMSAVVTSELVKEDAVGGDEHGAITHEDSDSAT